MRRQELITKLLATNQKKGHLRLFKQHPELIDLKLASDLKNTYYDSWTTAPKKTRNAATALEVLFQIFPDTEVKAMANWVRGIAFLTEGKIENAIVELDLSSELFRSLKKPGLSAQPQVGKLYALSLLGRYDEAVETGKAAIAILEKHRDLLTAGKIAMNLGNIALRRGFFDEAENRFVSARKRFSRLNENVWLTMCENDLAITYSALNDYRKAEKFYGLALNKAREMKMHVTEAEIEASMGNLALFRGQFQQALQFLELSRQKYFEMNMPHQTAIANLEIADIYLELNLTDEALSIYEKVAPSFKRLGMQGEEARSRANFGKAALRKNDKPKAKLELKKATQLYILEKDLHGAAVVKLIEAKLERSKKNYGAALSSILEARELLAKTGNPRYKLLSKWLHGDTLSNLKRTKSAEKLLTEALAEAIGSEQSNVALNCLNSLGDIAIQANDKQTAVKHFLRAVKLVELQRAPLATDEFRMNFLSDKRGPFENLAKIYLTEGDLKKAFVMIERARGRTLSENMGDDLVSRNAKAEPRLVKKLADLREELNWYYSRMDRVDESEIKNLQKHALAHEKQIVEVMRQIESTGSRNGNGDRSAPKKDKLRQLQSSLGKQKALIEFVSFDGHLSAFVVTDAGIEYFENVATETEIMSILSSLQFQFGSLRFGKQNVSGFATSLKKRADVCLQKLYERLARPFEASIGERDLVVVPVGGLHYVPFHALHNGTGYLIESREVVYSPSSDVWQMLNEKPRKKIQSALLIGYADASIPMVDREIQALTKIFPDGVRFTGSRATFSNYMDNAGKFDVLHLACHGQFRPDSPMFSNLHLANGYVTVRDICSQKLKAELVTLSACETGLNKVFAGDEILGLARGFLSAGAKSLVLSLWTVNDEATTRLMEHFYADLQRGATVAASLRSAQMEFIDRGEHPYYWSPFFSIGR